MAMKAMAADLHKWRKRNKLTQVDAASVLGVSQPYLSLLEKGARPLTSSLRGRMKAVRSGESGNSADDRFRAQLSALGYPGFAHIRPARMRLSPDAFLLSVLSQPGVDARVAEALPWLVRQYSHRLDLPWLVTQAKLRNLQNRLGFLLQLGNVETPEFATAVGELEKSRLLEEATFGWDSMPVATRDWMRVNRSPLAEHWNVLTRLGSEDLSYDS
jgi:transcriptional regulator with XRE-family HTH domain